MHSASAQQWVLGDHSAVKSQPKQTQQPRAVFLLGWLLSTVSPCMYGRWTLNDGDDDVIYLICLHEYKMSFSFPFVSFFYLADDEHFIIKRTSIPGQDTLGRLNNVSLQECHRSCHQTPGCRSYEYNQRSLLCDQNNATHLTHNLQPSKWGWDIYILNPGQ